MLGNLARKIFGTSNERVLRSMQPMIDAINAMESDIEKLSDKDLTSQTEKLRKKLRDGATEEDILVEAFATVREAAKRTLGERHYDVQLMGGLTLHEGKIAEMKTGEGKTLVSTLPVYLNALSGKGVHVVTVNDYLATRDAEWMGQVYQSLGLTVGVIKHGLNDEQRREAYACDITYGTNNEFGFDYLRDNMKFRLEDMVMRPFHYAIVDEVDSILIDEARTPLIISGPAEDSSEMYTRIDKLMPRLDESDYDKDEKMKAVSLNDKGMEKIENLLREEGLMESGSLYDFENIAVVHHVNMSLKAHTMFQADKDYIVKDGQVVIIDEFTGRMMPGRRYSEGLHQAIEAKEGVEIQRENQTLASITFQNYFRMYPKLAGMTGTALTEEEEFVEIYGLSVTAIPTNVPVERIDYDDEIYRTLAEKYEAMTNLVTDCQKRGQPVLVGTTSIEKSEELSRIFKKAKIKHHVLNARHHEKEAYIVAQAGHPGSVTIATNMAGRGTDIKLGGNTEMILDETLKGDETEAQIEKKRQDIRQQVLKNRDAVRDAGGLFVIGTERHESRRIDNQLRGRSGRQGDPGASMFYLSLEDDLMRIFGSERMDAVLGRLGMKEGEPLVHPWISKAIERAQKKVEAQHFDARKMLLKFDDVMNDQRKVIYEQRREVMASDDLSELIKDMRDETIDILVNASIPRGSYPESWDTDTLKSELHRVFNRHAPVDEWAQEEGIAEIEIAERITAFMDNAMQEKEDRFGADLMRQVEKSLLLSVLDQQWKEHLLNLDHLRQGINLRAIGQRDPLNEYKSEAFTMFEIMLDNLREQVTHQLAIVEIRSPEQMAEQERAMQRRQEAALRAADASHNQQSQNKNPPPFGTTGTRHAQAQTGTIVNKPSGPVDPNDPSTWGKVQRNAPCPCGSGKKYKHCHGKV